MTAAGQTTKTVKHLTEDELDEILMGIADSAASSHAETCQVCAGRLTQFRAALGEFNHASLAWSEARSNSLTRDLRAHRLSPTLSRPALWSCVSAGVVAAALLLTAGLEHHTAAGRNASMQASALAGSDYESSRQQEIAMDNEMLAAISSEIDHPTPIPSTLYEDVSGPGSHRRNASQAKD